VNCLIPKKLIPAVETLGNKENMSEKYTLTVNFANLKTVENLGIRCWNGKIKQKVIR
jgi:hypothetical protein